MKKITLLFAMLLVAILSYGQVTITPVWEFSVTNGNLGTAVDDVKNGFGISPDGTKLYLSTRTADADQVAIYDAATGTRTGYLPGLSGFQSQYGGDIAVDANGAIYASNVIISGTGALKVAKWSSESANPTLFISTTVFNAGSSNRVGYGMDVRVDASGNGFLLMHRGGTPEFLVWKITNNVPDSQDPTIVFVSAAGLPMTDSYARISIVDDTHFWVDGNQSLPIYCTIKLGGGIMPTTINAERIANRSDINTGVGGATEFTLNGKRFGVFAGNNHGSVAAHQPKHHAVIQELESTGVATSGDVLGKIPENGLGGTTDYTHFVEIVTHVAGNDAYVYLMGGANGIAAFKVNYIPTGLADKETMDVKVLHTSTGISVQFEGLADIELYGINGQLIDKTRVSNSYNKDLNKGVYIIRVNGKAIKFVK